MAIGRMNRREKEVGEYLENLGFEVYHKGYPDFLVYNPVTDEVSFVEVKRKQRHNTEKMGLSSHQKRVIELLGKIADVKVEYVE